MPHIPRHVYQEFHESLESFKPDDDGDMVRCEACATAISREHAERIEGGGWLCFTCAEDITEMNEGKI